MEFELGFWAKPIFVDGKYSEEMVKGIQNAGDAHADVLNLSSSESAMILGSSDFFGLNHYYSVIAENCNEGSNCPYGYATFSCPNWPQAGPYWLKSVPWGLRKLLNHIDNNYNSKTFPIYITENGVASLRNDATNGTDQNPNLEDNFRVNFYHHYIGQVHRAISEDNVNVKAYTAWTLMDNFEWARGINERFGLHWTNYTDPVRPVIPKQSSRFLAGIAKSQCINSSDGLADVCNAYRDHGEL